MECPSTLRFPQQQTSTTSDQDVTRTSAISILSSPHGRLRRAQRAIEKRDLQAAVRYGTRQRGFPCPRTGEGRWKYTFAEVVFVTNESCSLEITSWAVPGAGLDIDLAKITAEMQQEHAKACHKIRTNKSSWTSHTVVVVDQSGSMRKTDVAGGVTRSDAVWLMLATDLVAKQLENKTMSSTDVISIIGMNAHSTVLIDQEPIDWIVFNKIIGLLRSCEPKSDGNYLPALDEAERLLCINPSGACALMLLFLSDGKPSDQFRLDSHLELGLGERCTARTKQPATPGSRMMGTIVRVHSLQSSPEHNGVLGAIVRHDLANGRWHIRTVNGRVLSFKPSNLTIEQSHCAKMEYLMLPRIDDLSSRFGRRLAVHTVGFAGPDEDFSVLRAVANRPAEFDSMGTFMAAALTPESLGLAISSVTSSLISSKMELSAMGTMPQQNVRDVLREQKNEVEDNHYDPAKWSLVPLHKIESKMRWRESPNKTIEKFADGTERVFRESGWEHLDVQCSSTTIIGIAQKIKYFGEGAERLVAKFREVSADWTLSGHLMVILIAYFVSDLFCVRE